MFTIIRAVDMSSALPVDWVVVQGGLASIRNESGLGLIPIYNRGSILCAAQTGNV